MLAHLEALIALSEQGTMTRAAVKLRITQSAVSKRIAALEATLGRKLVEPDGRRVRLTAEAVRLLHGSRPLLAELKSLLLAEQAAPTGRLVLGVSESVLSSWGPKLLSVACARVPGLTLELNAHRSPVAVDHVLSGEYTAALVSGAPAASTELVCDLVTEEEMVLVPSGLDPSGTDLSKPVEVTTIEASSATWRALRRRLTLLRRAIDLDLTVRETMQSFACVVQLAKTGLCHGLAPVGISRALGVADEVMVRIPGPGLSRPVSLVQRKGALGRPLVARFRDAVVSEAKRTPQVLQSRG